MKQRPDAQAPGFLLFTAKAREVLEWAAVERFTNTSQDGPQRIEKPYKVKAICSFLQANEKNTIPTAVVIGFRPGSVKIEPVSGCQDVFSLVFDIADQIKDEDKPGTMVDGQHRVLGVSRFSGDTLLNIIGLVDVNDLEIAFQFLVINNKVSRVSSDHLRALALHYPTEELAERLQKVRLNLDPNLRFVGFANTLDDSPFKGLLVLPNNPPGSQIVPPAAIEDSVNFIQQQKLPEFEDDDMVLSIFFTIWRVIKEKWTPIWNKAVQEAGEKGEAKAPKTKLLNKVSVICLTQFFVNNLLRQFDWGGLDIFDPSVVEKEAEKIVAVLEPQFWDTTTEWTAKGLDTQAGRKILMEALEQMVRNARQKVPWHTDIPMVSLS